jgi:hypothetical protein
LQFSGPNRSKCSSLAPSMKKGLQKPTVSLKCIRSPPYLFGGCSDRIHFDAKGLARPKPVIHRVTNFALPLAFPSEPSQKKMANVDAPIIGGCYTDVDMTKFLPFMPLGYDYCRPYY